jgi:hypothetical protein
MIILMFARPITYRVAWAAMAEVVIELGLLVAAFVSSIG